MIQNKVYSHVAIVSFADGGYQWRQARRRLQYQLSKIEKEFNLKFKIYNLKDLNHDIGKDLLNFMRKQPACGLWIWKPIIILDFLHKNQDIKKIIYLDSGCEIIGNKGSIEWSNFLNMADSHDSVVFQLTEKEHDYSDKDLLTTLLVSEEDRESGQICATVFSMKRKYALDFCLDWLRLMYSDNFRFLNIKNYEGRAPIKYRFDQSIFSLLTKKRAPNKKILFLPISMLPHLRKKLSGQIPIYILRNKTAVQLAETSRFNSILYFFARIINRLMK